LRALIAPTSSTSVGHSLELDRAPKAALALRRSERMVAAEVHLLLRAHAEAKWLETRVIPVVDELERGPRRPRGHAGTTLAYLEVLWIEACGRAAETDGARVQLDSHDNAGQRLCERARRYHAAVRRLRAGVTPRVQRLIDPRRQLAAGRHARI